MLEYDPSESEHVVLTSEGRQIADEGSHEYKVWEAVKKSGRLSLKDPALATPSAKLGQGNAFKLKWVQKDGDSLVVCSGMDEVKDATRETLKYVDEFHTMPDPKQLKDYVKRKLVSTQKIITYQVRKGPRWAKEIPIEVTDLTSEMLEDGSWKTASFKDYNFNALGAQQNSGALHPLNKVREEFRKIFFNWDFIEMPTGR
jgi:phenylalanyl-tRNA synthetase alpha chain